MPLVPLETALHPPGLLREAPRDVSCRWWVAHTRPRAEKALARRLLARNLSFYLPFHKRQLHCRGRILSSQLPLFPGYLFLHGDQQARQQALETNLVALMLPVPDQIRFYADLVRIEQVIAVGAPLTSEDRLEPGDAVLIVAGPLTGLTGKILRRNKQLRFLVEVEFLRRGVSVEIESWMIEPCRKHHTVCA